MFKIELFSVKRDFSITLTESASQPTWKSVVAKVEVKRVTPGIGEMGYLWHRVCLVAL